MARSRNRRTGVLSGLQGLPMIREDVLPNRKGQIWMSQSILVGCWGLL